MTARVTRGKKNKNKNKNKSKRILVVDNEPDVSIVLKRVLEQAGFDAESYDDPNLALKNFRAGLYDLILLDIKMPGMDGFSLYQELKKLDNNAKICFVTASEMYFSRFRKDEDFCTLDEDLFIRKPIENEELIKKIDALFNKSS
jgi:DNA-binding response OmpR family regulator